MNNLIKTFKLQTFHTFYINVEGVGQWVFENPKVNGNKIYDRITDSLLTHNFKSMTRIGSSIFINFVHQDDEDGKIIDTEDIGTLYTWLCVKPKTDQEIIDEFLDEYTMENK